MVINGANLNLFSQASVMPAINPAKAVGLGSSSAGSSGGSASSSNNPSQNGDNKFGVGLVNSNLAGMSYKLPNGTQSTCNTIGIA